MESRQAVGDQAFRSRRPIQRRLHQGYACEIQLTEINRDSPAFVWGSLRMNRLLVILLLVVCATLQGWAQTLSGQNSTGQSTASEQKTTTPDQPASEAASPTPSASSGFPLDQFQEFSAIMNGGPLPGSDWDGHIYRSGNMMRMEGMDSHNYFVTDLAKNQTHGLAASGCINYSFPYTRTFPFSLSRPGNTYERVSVGEETVDGHRCRVEDLSISFPKPHPLVKLRLWEAEDLQGFPIKIETRTTNFHRTIQYKNVILGPQDSTLFIFPTECQVMKLGGMAKTTKSAPGSSKPGSSKAGNSTESSKDDPK